MSEAAMRPGSVGVADLTRDTQGPLLIAAAP
jgi:hypothetical protein